MRIDGVLHLGAHLGEEAQAYADAGIRRVVWVEANPAVMPELVKNVEPYGHYCINALISDVDGQVTTLNVTNNGMSSSILELGYHKVASPDVHYVSTVAMASKTVDTLMFENEIVGCNFLNMDLQGAELLALKGATKTLESIDYVYTEVNEKELYRQCARTWELDAFLTDFQRVETKMAGPTVGWGDAFYIRRSLL